VRAFESCFVVEGQRRTDTVYFDVKARRGIADTARRSERKRKDGKRII